MTYPQNNAEQKHPKETFKKEMISKYIHCIEP